MRQTQRRTPGCERPIERYRPTSEDSNALLIDILFRLEPIDQRLDTLFLRIRRSGSLGLLRVVRRAGKITCCRLDARLS